VEKKTAAMGLFRTAVRREPRWAELSSGVSSSNVQGFPIRVFLNETAFASTLYLERRRAERAGKRYVLMLVDVKDVFSSEEAPTAREKITQILS